MQLQPGDTQCPFDVARALQTTSAGTASLCKCTRMHSVMTYRKKTRGTCVYSTKLVRLHKQSGTTTTHFIDLASRRKWGSLGRSSQRSRGATVIVGHAGHRSFPYVQ